MSANRPPDEESEKGKEKATNESTVNNEPVDMDVDADEALAAELQNEEFGLGRQDSPEMLSPDDVQMRGANAPTSSTTTSPDANAIYGSGPPAAASTYGAGPSRGYDKGGIDFGASTPAVPSDYGSGPPQAQQSIYEQAPKNYGASAAPSVNNENYGGMKHSDYGKAFDTYNNPAVKVTSALGIDKAILQETEPKPSVTLPEPSSNPSVSPMPPRQRGGVWPAPSASSSSTPSSTAAPATPTSSSTSSPVAPSSSATAKPNDTSITPPSPSEPPRPKR